MKKLVIFLFIIVLLFIGLNYYYQQKYKTIECWWGVLYPNLSFIGFENDTKYSSINEIKPNNKIQYKSFIFEWLKEKFSL